MGRRGADSLQRRARPETCQPEVEEQQGAALGRWSTAVDSLEDLAKTARKRSASSSSTYDHDSVRAIHLKKDLASFTNWTVIVFHFACRLHQERRGNTVDSDTRWMAQDKAGDLCYIDDRGWIYVDRLKELIKCKGYEVRSRHGDLHHSARGEGDFSFYCQLSRV
ncbi:4-coumarate--CoA ligase-like 4 isoform X2 [Lolium rigidum]|nr:4-coumarate--CoA ligase-like 4 isoform X2 [Lolium rigidum]